MCSAKRSAVMEGAWLELDARHLFLLKILLSLNWMKFGKSAVERNLNWQSWDFGLALAWNCALQFHADCWKPQSTLYLSLSSAMELEELNQNCFQSQRPLAVCNTQSVQFLGNAICHRRPTRTMTVARCVLMQFTYQRKETSSLAVWQLQCCSRKRYKFLPALPCSPGTL